MVDDASCKGGSFGGWKKHQALAVWTNYYCETCWGGGAMSPELFCGDSVGTLILFQIENQVALAAGSLGSHCLRHKGMSASTYCGADNML